MVTGRYGTLGEVFYVPLDFWPLNTSLYVKDFKGNNARFICYLLRTLNFGTQNVAGAVPGVNRNFLHQLPTRKPPLEVQRRIASILSAYDDLIENNTRRIAILEEMARTLYREWFVHFRFPGHETVEMVESPLTKIPDGWEVRPFGQLFDIQYGKTLPMKQLRADGEYPVYGAGGIIGRHSEFTTDGPTALVTSRGNGSGTVWRTRERAFVTNNSFMIHPLVPFAHWNYLFIELVLSHSNIASIIGGAAQPQVTISGLSAVQAVAPPRQLVQRFSELASPMGSYVDALHRRNALLRATRDLLVPKLISGEIDVSRLPDEPGAELAP